MPNPEILTYINENIKRMLVQLESTNKLLGLTATLQLIQLGYCTPDELEKYPELLQYLDNKNKQK